MVHFSEVLPNRAIGAELVLHACISLGTKYFALPRVIVLCSGLVISRAKTSNCPPALRASQSALKNSQKQTTAATMVQNFAVFIVRKTNPTCC
jgi:hypothetical protein